MAIWLGTIDWWIVTIGISELTGEEILMTLKILFWISTFYSLDTLTNIFNTFFIHFCQFWKSVLYSGQGLRDRQDVTSHPVTDLVYDKFYASCYQIHRKHDIFQCKDETHNLYFSHDRWNRKPRMNCSTPQTRDILWMELLLLFYGTYFMHSMKNYL